MIYPEVSCEEWIKKYPGLKVKEFSCKDCKKTVLINRPYLTKDYAGFEVTVCPHCSSSQSAATAVIVSKSEKSKWRI